MILEDHTQWSSFVCGCATLYQFVYIINVSSRVPFSLSSFMCVLRVFVIICLIMYSFTIKKLGHE